MSLAFAVVNQSTLVTDADVGRMVGAWQRQLRDHVAPAWNLAPPTVRHAAGPGDVPVGAIPGYVLDDADQQGALGYHDEQGGKPYWRIFARDVLDNGGTVLDGPMSVAVTGSHELCEALVNCNINGWYDDGGSRLVAAEVGDPVENEAYTVGYYGRQIAVSDFVFPAWFDAQRRGAQVDYLRRVSAPRTMAHGGYTIVATVSGEGQRFGRDIEFASEAEAEEYPEWRTAVKLTPGSRTLRLIA